MFENLLEKDLKLEKRSTIGYVREKKVDKDAICSINVICCKSRFFEHSTKNCILEPKIAF